VSPVACHYQEQKHKVGCKKRPACTLEAVCAAGEPVLAKYNADIRV